MSGVEAARADDLAGFVGGAGDHRQALRECRWPRAACGADLADAAARRHQLGQHVGA